MIQKTLIALFFALAANADAQMSMIFKHRNLKGTVYMESGEAIKVRLKSMRKIEVSKNASEDIYNMFQTLWLTKYGRRAIIHLLRSKSKITIRFSENVGYLKFVGDSLCNSIYALTGHSGAEEGKNGKLILDYDGGYTYTTQTITIYKGSFYMGIDTNYVVGDNYEVVDQKTGMEINVAKNSLVKYIYNPNNPLVIHNYRWFIYLCFIHEIEHTTSKNISTTINGGDAEVIPYKKEDTAKKKLKKVLRSKKMKCS